MNNTMNNKYFLLAICLLSLTGFPACKKGKSATPKKEEITKVIELNNTVVKTDHQQSIEKF